MKKFRNYSCWNQHAFKKFQKNEEPIFIFINAESTESTKSSIAYDLHLWNVIKEDYLFFTLIPVATEAVRRWYLLCCALGPPPELISFTADAKILFNLDKASAKWSCFLTAIERWKWCWVLFTWKRKLIAIFISWKFLFAFVQCLLLSTG